MFVSASLITLTLLAVEPADASSQSEPRSAVEESGGVLTPLEAAAAEKIADTISTSEFLGPLAPVALSPFFGVACLSGMAQFGPESLGSNAMLSESSPLSSPWVFWVFSTLAVLTSLPRLTKVSKPIAGAVDQIEAWSGIITMGAVKFLAGGPTAGKSVALAADPILIAGVGSIGLDVALAIAAGVNILVVNSVKFFFEFLVWITPVPFLDACFEAANKAVCAALMAVYAFSPTVSLALNLAVFAICLVAFFWIHRQVLFFRTMLVDWLLGWFREPSPQAISRRPLVVFPKEAVGPFAARERLTLERTKDGWQLRTRSLLRASKSATIAPESTDSSADVGGSIEPGWAAHTLRLRGLLDGQPIGPLLVSRRYRKSLQTLADAFTLELVQEAPRDRERLRTEVGYKRPATD